MSQVAVFPVCVCERGQQETKVHSILFPRMPIVLNFMNLITIMTITTNRFSGKGICFYFKSTINFSVRSGFNIDELENLCIENRKPNPKPFIVVNCPAEWVRS